MTTSNVGSAYESFLVSETVKEQKNLLKNLKTALKRYVLPTYGFENVEDENLVLSLSQISIKDFADAPARLKQHSSALAEANKISSSTLTNYITPVNKFIVWIKEQPWYLEAINADTNTHARRKRENRNKGSSCFYGLTKEELTPKLIEQLSSLQHFCTDQDVPNRKFPPITEGGFEHRKDVIRRFLGWLKAYKNFSADDYSIELITNFALVKEFIDWAVLNRNSSPSWVHDILRVSQTVVQWVYRNESVDLDNLEEIQAIDRYRPTVYRESSGRGGTYRRPYGLTEADLTPKLVSELEGLHSFCTDEFVKGRNFRAIRPVTWKNYQNWILIFLYWLKDIQGIPIQELYLELFIDIDIFSSFIEWGLSEKKKSYEWATQMVCAAQMVAKKKYHGKGEDYDDCPEIRALRKFIKTNLKDGRQKEQSKAKDKKRKIVQSFSIEDIDLVIKELRKDCVAITSTGRKRPLKEQIKARLRYLIVKFLRYCPLRQRELREMELHRTLLKEKHPHKPNSHCYVVDLEAGDHKSGARTGEGREFQIPDELTEDIDDWLTNWRPKAEINHNFVFFSLGGGKGQFGAPIKNTASIWGVVGRATKEFLGQWINPHLFRDLAVTWQREYGNREQDEGLAEIMGHTKQEADKTYKHLSSRKKTDKATDWHSQVHSSPTTSPTKSSA